MAVRYNPKIITDGLVSYYDPGNILSYSGSGTALNDLMGNHNGTLAGSPSFSSTTSPISGSVAKIVVVEVDVVESVRDCSDSSDPPHAEVIREKISIVIFNFFIFLALFLYYIKFFYVALTIIKKGFLVLNSC